MEIISKTPQPDGGLTIRMRIHDRTGQEYNFEERFKPKEVSESTEEVLEAIAMREAWVDYSLRLERKLLKDKRQGDLLEQDSTVVS